MADNPFLGDGLRPDQQKWASTGMGAMSPMWMPFIAAASAGAAWWAMTHWARVMGAGYPGVTARGPGSDGATGGAARSAHPSAQPLDAVSARSTEVAAPQDAPTARDIGSEAEALASGLSHKPAGDALSESLAVQGEDASADAVMPVAPPEAAASAPQPARAEPVVSARVESGAASTPKAAAPEASKPAVSEARASAVSVSASGSGDQPASATDNDDHPAPTLPPHEGLPARKKGGKKKPG